MLLAVVEVVVTATVVVVTRSARQKVRRPRRQGHERDARSASVHGRAWVWATGRMRRDVGFVYLFVFFGGV